MRTLADLLHLLVVLHRGGGCERLALGRKRVGVLAVALVVVG